MMLAVFTGWFDRQERQAISVSEGEEPRPSTPAGQRRLKFTDPTGDAWRSAGIGWDSTSCVSSPPS